MKLEPRNFKISTRLLIGFIVIQIVLVSVLIVLYFNTNTIIKSYNLIVHTHEVLKEVSDLESKLIDLETGQRGFIITGKLEYLEPYNNGLNVIENKLTYLKELTSDNKSQTQRIGLLKEMIDAKLDKLNTTIKIRQSEGFEAAKRIVDRDDGKIIMDKIRAQLLKITNEELRLLEERSIRPIIARKKTDFILIALLVYGLIVSFLIAFFTSRSIINPIKSLINGTKIIGQGNLDYKFENIYSDEIGQLSNSFELMLQNLKVNMASKDILEKEIENRKTTEKNLRKTAQMLKKNEIQLLESNRTKDKFFSIISHDLRNPFNALLGFSRILDEDFDNLTKTQQKKYIGIIHTGLENTFVLLENLLFWSLAQRGLINFEPRAENIFLISKQTVEAIIISAESKSINIKTEIPDDIYAETDKGMFNTIIRNLLSNAIKFTPKNGEILLTVNLENDDNDFVEIKVKDNGTGISEEIKNKLFVIDETKSTPGTANEPGTGLGLNICQEFVKMHGGNIWVDSEIGKGSTFYFTLPKAKNHNNI